MIVIKKRIKDNKMECFITHPMKKVIGLFKVKMRSLQRVGRGLTFRKTRKNRQQVLKEIEQIKIHIKFSLTKHYKQELYYLNPHLKIKEVNQYFQVFKSKYNHLLKLKNLPASQIVPISKLIPPKLKMK